MGNKIIIAVCALATFFVTNSRLQARPLRVTDRALAVQDDYCPPPSDDQDPSDQDDDSSQDCAPADDSRPDDQGQDDRRPAPRAPWNQPQYPGYPSYHRTPVNYGDGDDSTDRISHVDVDTDLPFIDFNADISVNTDDSGTIQSVTLSGNIPGVGTQTLSISEFVNGGIRAQGLAIRAEPGFSPSRGGAVDVDAVLCSGGSGHSRFYLGSSGGTWRLSGGAQISLKAKTSYGRFGGCFYSVNAN